MQNLKLCLLSQKDSCFAGSMIEEFSLCFYRHRNFLRSCGSRIYFYCYQIPHGSKTRQASHRDTLLLYRLIGASRCNFSDSHERKSWQQGVGRQDFSSDIKLSNQYKVKIGYTLYNVAGILLQYHIIQKEVLLKILKCYGKA